MSSLTLSRKVIERDKHEEALVSRPSADSSGRLTFRNATLSAPAPRGLDEEAAAMSALTARAQRHGLEAFPGLQGPALAVLGLETYTRVALRNPSLRGLWHASSTPSLSHSRSV